MDTANTGQQAASINTGVYTIASVPPVAPRTQRRSRWAIMFDECRAVPGEWRRVIEPLSKASAAQIASDIRNASHRNHNKSRMRGFEAGERWEAAWGADPTDADQTHFYVWLRYIGAAEQAA